MTIIVVDTIVDPAGVGSQGMIDGPTSDGYVVVIGGNGLDVLVVNVNDPSNLAVAGRIVGAASGGYIAISNTHAYISGAAGGTIKIVDFTDRSAPFVAVASFDIGVGGDGEATPLLVDGNRLHLSASPSGNDRYQIWDVSVPTAPVLVGQGSRGVNEGSPAGCLGPPGFFITGGRDAQRVWDIVPEATPTTSASAGRGIPNTLGAFDAAYANGYAYISINTSSGEPIRVYDVDPTSAMTEILNGFGNQRRGLAFGPDGLLWSGGAPLARYDVSIPTAPVLVDSVTAGGTSSGYLVVLPSNAAIIIGNNSIIAVQGPLPIIGHLTLGGLHA